MMWLSDYDCYKRPFTFCLVVFMTKTVISVDRRPTFGNDVTDASIDGFNEEVTKDTNNIDVWQGFLPPVNTDMCQNYNISKFSSIKDVCIGDVRPWSCSGRCGDDVSNPCSCHVACMAHSSCCHDFEAECSEMYPRTTNYFHSILSVMTKCIHNSLFISDCPLRTTASQRWKCNKGDSLLESIDFPPVTDSKTLWNFRNQFCWECWGFDGKPIPWRLGVTLDKDESNSEIYFSSKADVIRDPSMIQMLPPNGAMHFPCLSATEEVDSTCSHCASDEDIHNCGKYHSNIIAGRLPLRNVHCLFCIQAYGNFPKLKCDVIARRPNSGPSKYVAELSMQKVADNTTILLTFNPDPKSPKEETVKWSVLECNTSCRATRCQPGVVHRDFMCDAERYIRTLAIKLCISTEAEGNETSCRFNETEQFALDNGTHILRSLPLSNHGRLSLVVGETLTFIRVSNIFQFMRVLSSSPVEVMELIVPELVHALNVAIRETDNTNKMTMDMKIFLRADTHELFLLVLQMHTAFIEKGRLMEVAAVNGLNEYLGSRRLSFKVMCYYNLPGLLLDMDLLDNETLCAGSNQANNTNARGTVNELIAFLICAVGQFFIMHVAD